MAGPILRDRFEKTSRGGRYNRCRSWRKPMPLARDVTDLGFFFGIAVGIFAALLLTDLVIELIQWWMDRNTPPARRVWKRVR